MRFSTSPKHHLLRNSALLAALIVNTSVASAVGLTSAGVQVSNMMLSTAAPGSSELTFGGTVVNHLGLFDIVIVPTAALAANAGAMAAFNRAAAKWEAIFSDPITVTINADLMNLGSPSIIGSTSSVLLRGSFDTIRDELGIDSALDANDGINAFLPTSAQFSATVPSGFTLDGNLLATKANLKAMGFLGLDGLFGASDASILFNSGFAFDFDNSNGVSPGLIDFETVAVHEIGHALGFVSSVDFVDGSIATPTAFSPEPLDLFRFRDGTANDPTTPADFTIFPRDLSTNTNAITDFILPTLGGEAVENRMSTGVATGDGRQASHWKDDVLTGIFIGVMDPPIAPGVVENIQPADIRALDLIGWDVVLVPEPAGAALLASAMLPLAFRRRARG